MDRKFIIYTPALDFKVGGIIALHQLANELSQLNHQVFLYTFDGTQYENIFCNQFATLKDVDDSTIVIYPEIIEGNPLNAKQVVRWLLCDLGIHTQKSIYKTWGKRDLLFHFSTFNAKYDPHSIEILYTPWIDPGVKNHHLQRSGSCYLFKKGSSFHKNLEMIHPFDAVMIDRCNLGEIIEVFNRKEYFYSYDPYSFYDVIALLCGCIPVIYPLKGVSKFDWLKTRATFQILLTHQDNISGLAYGLEDIPYAKNTLGKAEKEQKDSLEFGKKSVKNLVDLVNGYFFNGQKYYSYKTVEEISKKLFDKYDNLEPNEQLHQKEMEIKKLQEMLQRKEEEISCMKSSKIWKLLQFLKWVYTQRT